MLIVNSVGPDILMFSHKFMNSRVISQIGFSSFSVLYIGDDIVFHVNLRW